MEITIEYSAQVKTAAGIPSETIELSDGASTNDLLTTVSEQHGDPLRGVLLDESGAPQRSILVFVGEEQSFAESPLALRDRDRVVVLSPVSGG